MHWNRACLIQRHGKVRHLSMFVHVYEGQKEKEKEKEERKVRESEHSSDL